MGRKLTMLVLGGFLAAHAAIAAQGTTAQKPGPAPGETLSESYRGSQRDNVEYQKIPPIKLFDNLFYVGPGSCRCGSSPRPTG